MKYVYHILLYIPLLASGIFVHAQVTPPPDSLSPNFIPRDFGIRRDTIPGNVVPKDFGIRPDSLQPVEEIHIRISPDSLDAKVDYGSVDSNYLDNSTKKVHLYGQAYVRYKELSITADYIVVDLDSSIATAEYRLDSLGKPKGIPEFKMGDEQFQAKKMRYNFKTRIGKIYEALTKEGDLYIHGEQTKFVANADTITHDDILYGKRALITTCDAEHPHFGIRASKIKTIPDKLAVVGSSNLEIFGIPTPVWLPFGFYPVSETRRAGIIFPRDYERSQTFGFGLRELGYYLPLSDNIDLKLVGDIYFNGTWGAGVISNYVKKYKYRGNIDLRYSVRIQEKPNDYRKLSDKSFSIRITHNQDPKANPYQKIGGTIDIKSNDFQSLNYNDAASVFTNSYSSNFNYSRQFPGKPYSLSAALTHSQNTRTHLVTINAPNLDFRVNRIYPFKNNKRVGPEQWYEKIAFTYSGSGKTLISTTDTTLFDAETWKNFQYGAQHKANASVNFNVLKYFNFTPSVDYGETWFFKTRDRMFRFDPSNPRFVRTDTIWNPDSTEMYFVYDTIRYGEVTDSTFKTGFTPFREFRASINMNTQVFGTLTFKKGWLRGIRHVIKPSIGFSYSPESPDSYYQYVQESVLYPDSVKRFNRFSNLLYSANPTDIKQANINYSITNLFEAKFFSRRDSLEKKLKLFDNINISGSYNMAADTNKWSPINISGNTRLFKGITTITVGATYSFYALNEKTGGITRHRYDSIYGHLLRFDNFRLRFSTRVSYQDVMKLFSGKDTDATSGGKSAKQSISVRDRFFDLLSNFSVSHEMGIQRRGLIGKDTTFITTHSVNMVGSMRLTPNWSINFGNIGYDFRAKQLTYPDIGLTRDLHCWQLSFNFQPDRNTYSFHLGVKPGTFDFLKFPYRRNREDAFQEF